jgi:hypothetical protein
MPARIIYLDQNKWIELARAVSAKATPELLQVLDILRESKRLGLNVFRILTYPLERKDTLWSRVFRAIMTRATDLLAKILAELSYKFFWGE